MQKERSWTSSLVILLYLLPVLLIVSILRQFDLEAKRYRDEQNLVLGASDIKMIFVINDSADRYNLVENFKTLDNTVVIEEFLSNEEFSTLLSPDMITKINTNPQSTVVVNWGYVEILKNYTEGFTDSEIIEKFDSRFNSLISSLTLADLRIVVMKLSAQQEFVDEDDQKRLEALIGEINNKLTQEATDSDFILIEPSSSIEEMYNQVK